MRIEFSPNNWPAAPVLTVTKAGDVLTINGEAFDFSTLPDGATIPAGEVPCEWVVGPVERIGGDLHVTLLLPHGADPSPAVAFPNALIDPPDGPLVIPHDEEPANVDA